jgi:hypothetical protein
VRRLEEAIGILDRIIGRADFRGYDPYDALNSPLLLWLARRSRWAGIVFTQAFRFLPLNVRPVLGIPQLVNAKTMALLARAYLKLYACSQDTGYLERARICLDWLDAHRSPGFANACWGYPFPWCTVRQFLERDAPPVVCTSFVAHAFLDTYKAWGETRHLAVARSACDFILNDCPRIARGESYCFSYTPFGELPVHNANLLGVSILGRVYRHTNESALLDAALPALRYTLDDQNANGSWYYHGPYPGRDDAIDNFHTGFVLECLRQFQADTGHDVSQAVERGQAFYERRFFDADGTPWRKIGRRYPVDIRDVAELLVVMGQLGRLNESQRRLVDLVLQWASRAMQHRSGYFYSLRWHSWGYSPLYLRWQAWMLWGLANVLPLYRDEER